MARFTRVFGVPKLRVDFVRGLRFRLAVSYVLFFAFLLIAIGLLFRENLKIQLEGDDRAAVEESWDVARSYLKIENFRPVWLADMTDPDEAYVVRRLQHVFLITDEEGNALQWSTVYESIGIDSRDYIQKVLDSATPDIHVRYDKDGTPYLIRSGWERDETGKKYFV